MSAFTWIPFYKELADKLLAYRDRQGELIALLKELKDDGIPVISLDDKAAKNRTVPLSTIDPFTFFAAFNRKATDQNRQAVLAKIKDRLQVQAAVPTDFDVQFGARRNLHSLPAGFGEGRRARHVCLGRTPA